MADYATLLRDHVTLTCRSVDRIFLQAYVPRLQSVGMVCQFLRWQRGFPIPSSAAFGKIGAAYPAEVHRFAKANGIPVRHFAKGEKKEEIARPFIDATAAGGKGAVALIGIAQEKAMVWRSWPAKGQRGAAHPHMEWGRQMAFVNHFYFYLWDAEWGPAFWKTNAYAPYPVWLWLNGHEWAKRQLVKAGAGYTALAHGFASCADPALLQRLCDRLGPGAVAALVSVGYVHDFVPIGLALTTTALGTLLPILHDNDMLSGKFGRYVLAAGAVGELSPIVAISLFLTHRKEFIAFASIVAVGVVAILPRIIGATALQAIIQQVRRATAQTTLRWSIVLLLVLLVAAAKFGLDVVLGAMLAEMVLRSWTRRMGVDVTPLEGKLDAVGYGFLIPVFFVVSGMTLDIQSIAANPLRLVIFFVLLLGVRGLPSLLVYRHALPLRQRVEMTFITATTMPC
jgi:hypothetical protein